MWSCCSPRSSSRPAAGASGPGRTQVSRLHLRVALDFGRGAGRDDAAEVEHVDPGADPHDQLHVVLDEPGQAGRETVHPLIGHAPQPNPIEQLLGALGRWGAVLAGPAPAHVGRHPDVVADRHRPEDLEALERAGDTEPGPLVGGHTDDVAAVEPDPAPLDRLQAADGVEERRLAGAVRPDEPGRLAGRHVQVHEVQRLDASEGHGDLLDLEERHGPHCRTRSREPPRERQPCDDEGDGGQSVTGQQTFRRTLLVFIGLQLGQVMSSIDGTIVATALPTIAGDIGGFSRSTWVVTAYALAMVASMPIYGKLGDLYGRRRGPPPA